MLDVVVGTNILDPRIRYPTVIVEKGREVSTGDVAAFVDGRREYCAPMRSIPEGVIGSASKERNPERRSCNDHYSILCIALTEFA